MKDFYLFIVILLLGTILAFAIFTNGQDSLKKECNGEKIGSENSGQMRGIYKCADGQIEIL